jgi:CheY-like chemotaxis protein/HPt (histidine-containing phosphotransfer) domain-containing protein
VARERLQPFTGVTARILLAEDNPTNQKVALAMLKKLGLHADAVANGIEALQSLEFIPYDLVLMDVRMPGMDGLEATRRIRDPHSAVRNHALPIIAMTANAMASDREDCLQAGMSGFVPKPVSLEALREELERWLRPGGDTDSGKAQLSAPLPAGEEQAPVFNRAGVLQRMMGDEELAMAVITAFLDDMPHQIEDLKDLLRAGDATGSGRLAHSIKGAAANVGGERLRHAALEMEKAADAGNLDVAQAGMANLEAQFLLLAGVASS